MLLARLMRMAGEVGEAFWVMLVCPGPAAASRAFMFAAIAAPQSESPPDARRARVSFFMEMRVVAAVAVAVAFAVAAAISGGGPGRASFSAGGGTDSKYDDAGKGVAGGSCCSSPAPAAAGRAAGGGGGLLGRSMPGSATAPGVFLRWGGGGGGGGGAWSRADAFVLLF